MRRMLCLFSLLATTTLYLMSLNVDDRFISACGLVSQAAAARDEVCELYSQGLDAVDAVGRGESDVATAKAAVKGLSAALRAYAPDPLDISDDQKAFLAERSLSPEDYQAAVTDSALNAGYYADSLDSFVQTWDANPGASSQDTRLARLGLRYENQMTFVAFNTLLLPQDDNEALAIRLLVMNYSAFMKDANLPWERDVSLCKAKFDALEEQYAAALEQLQTTLDDMQATLDAATP